MSEGGSLSPPKSTPHLSSPETSIRSRHPHGQKIPRQDDICYRCRGVGHWSRHCPLNSPNSKFTDIYCRCGHGFCMVKTAKNDRNFGKSYYVCPIKRGKKCKDFVKWCNDPIDESDLRPPLYKYPTCSCGAGVCRKEKETSGPNEGRYFFACPIRDGHGACSFHLWEDTLLGIPNIPPPQQSSGELSQEMEIDIGGDDGADLSTPLNHGDDLDDIDMIISLSWESLEENARSILHLSPCMTHDLSPEEHIQHHEEEKVRLAHIPDNYFKPQEHTQHYQEEKERLATIHDSYVKTKAQFEGSQQRCQSLREEASRLRVMLLKVEGDITSCELATKEMETHLGEIQASMMANEKSVKIAAEQQPLQENLVTREKKENCGEDSTGECQTWIRELVLSV